MIYKLVFLLYKILFSWIIKIFFGGGCRYIPTCSKYAEESLEIHGLLKGSKLSIERLLRCHPWSSFGYDPVPPKHRSH